MFLVNLAQNACQPLSGERFMMSPGTKSEQRLENLLHQIVIFNTSCVLCMQINEMPEASYVTTFLAVPFLTGEIMRDR